MRHVIDQMLAMIDRRSWSLEGGEQRFAVTIAKTRIDFDTEAPSTGLALERLACAVEAAISAERARQMLALAEAANEPLPLWLVSGSDILAKWLVWAGASNALRKVLTLSDAVGTAPISGYLNRRARRDLGQGGAKIRVRGGMAVAERIELSDAPRCTAILGEKAMIRIEQHRLPDTVITALQRDARSKTLRPLGGVVSHPFFTAADLGITGIANSGAAVVFEVESHWVPLVPVPATARAAIPADADPVFPWRATVGERRRLDELVEEARHRVTVARDHR